MVQVFIHVAHPTLDLGYSGINTRFCLSQYLQDPARGLDNSGCAIKVHLWEEGKKGLLREKWGKPAERGNRSLVHEPKGTRGPSRMPRKRLLRQPFWRVGPQPTGKVPRITFRVTGAGTLGTMGQDSLRQ